MKKLLIQFGAVVAMAAAVASPFLAIWAERNHPVDSWIYWAGWAYMQLLLVATCLFMVGGTWYAAGLWWDYRKLERDKP